MVGVGGGGTERVSDVVGVGEGDGIVWNVGGVGVGGVRRVWNVVGVGGG